MVLTAHEYILAMFVVLTFVLCMLYSLDQIDGLDSSGLGLQHADAEQFADQAYTGRNTDRRGISEGGTGRESS